MQLYKGMHLYYMHKSHIGKQDTMRKKCKKLEFGSQQGSAISVIKGLERIIIN